MRGLAEATRDLLDHGVEPSACAKHDPDQHQPGRGPELPVQPPPDRTQHQERARELKSQAAVHRVRSPVLTPSSRAASSNGALPIGFGWRRSHDFGSPARARREHALSRRSWSNCQGGAERSSGSAGPGERARPGSPGPAKRRTARRLTFGASTLVGRRAPSTPVPRTSLRILPWADREAAGGARPTGGPQRPCPAGIQLGFCGLSPSRRIDSPPAWARRAPQPSPDPIPQSSRATHPGPLQA